MADLSSVAEGLSNYPPTNLSFPTNPDLYGSLLDQPPPSILPSEASSAFTSDSELPPPSSIKATKKTNLFNFFPKIPSDEPHARWQKRKWENEDKDEEERTEQKQREEAENLHKLTKKRANNQASQKRRDRIKEEQAALSEAEQDSSVSSLVHTPWYQYMLIVL